MSREDKVNFNRSENDQQWQLGGECVCVWGGGLVGIEKGSGDKTNARERGRRGRGVGRVKREGVGMNEGWKRSAWESGGQLYCSTQLALEKTDIKTEIRANWHQDRNQSKLTSRQTDIKTEIRANWHQDRNQSKLTSRQKSEQTDIKTEIRANWHQGKLTPRQKSEQTDIKTEIRANWHQGKLTSRQKSEQTNIKTEIRANWHQGKLTSRQKSEQTNIKTEIKKLALMWISHFQRFLTTPRVVLLKGRYNKCNTLLSPVGWKVALKWHVQVCMQIQPVNAPKKNNSTSKYFLPTHRSFSQSNCPCLEAFGPHRTNLHTMVAVQST